MKRPILIVGGNIGGLTAALAMQRRGLDVVVLEREPRIREDQHPHQLWATAMAGLGRLEVVAQSRPIEFYRLRCRRGKTLANLPVGQLARDAGLPPPAMVRRPLVLAAIARLLSNDAVRWEYECVGFDHDDEGVTARLADGGEIRGAVLVGADGVDSLVRRALFPGVEPRFAGYTYVQAVTRFEGWPAGDFAFMFGRGDRFLIHDLGDASIYWAAVLLGGAPAGRAAKPDVLERIKEFAAPATELIESTNEETFSATEIRFLEPMERWGEGRVTLLGDAVHAPTPNLGRGGGEAILDGLVLADMLASRGVGAPALRVYEEARSGAAAKVVRQTRRVGAMASWSNPVTCAVRDQVIKRVASRVAPKGMAKDLRAASIS